MKATHYGKQRNPITPSHGLGYSCLPMSLPGIQYWGIIYLLGPKGIEMYKAFSLADNQDKYDPYKVFKKIERRF